MPSGSTISRVPGQNEFLIIRIAAALVDRILQIAVEERTVNKEVCSYFVSGRSIRTLGFLDADGILLGRIRGLLKTYAGNDTPLSCGIAGSS